MPTARISSAVNANEPRVALKSGLTKITTRAPSCGLVTSNTWRVQTTCAETAAIGSLRVRNTVLPRFLHSAICPSTQTRPSFPIQPLTSCSTVRTGTGDSADVSRAMPLSHHAGLTVAPISPTAADHSRRRPIVGVAHTDNRFAPVGHTANASPCPAGST